MSMLLGASNFSSATICIRSTEGSLSLLVLSYSLCLFVLFVFDRHAMAVESGCLSRSATCSSPTKLHCVVECRYRHQTLEEKLCRKHTFFFIWSLWSFKFNMWVLCKRYLLYYHSCPQELILLIYYPTSSPPVLLTPTLFNLFPVLSHPVPSPVLGLLVPMDLLTSTSTCAKVLVFPVVCCCKAFYSCFMASWAAASLQ